MKRSLKKIILASKSTDRSDMFIRAGIDFETFTTNIDEEKYKLAIQDGIELVKELAKAKALFAKKKLKNQTENELATGFFVCPVCGNIYENDAVESKCAFCQTGKDSFIEF